MYVYIYIYIHINIRVCVYIYIYIYIYINVLSCPRLVEKGRRRPGVSKSARRVYLAGVHAFLPLLPTKCIPIFSSASYQCKAQCMISRSASPSQPSQRLCKSLGVQNNMYVACMHVCMYAGM